MKAGVNAPGYNNALGELDRWLVETVVAFTKMERTVQFLLGVSVCIALSGCSRAHPSNVDAAQIRAKLDAIPLDRKVDLTNKEWLVILSPQQFYVMRRAGTELPSLSGNALDHHNGTYVCSACGNPLYGAETKFNSGTGWPSFWQPIRKEAVRESSTSSVIFGVETCLQRRTASNWIALLHERRGTDVPRSLPWFRNRFDACRSEPALITDRTCNPCSIVLR